MDDPASTLDSILDDPLQGDKPMEWYGILAIMVVWDIVRSVFTAWLTKWWINKRTKRSKNESKTKKVAKKSKKK